LFISHFFHFPKFHLFPELSFQEFPLFSGIVLRVGAVIAVLVVLVGVHVERHILPVVVLILIFVLVVILAKV
jgi:hypothetical protein